MSPTALAATGHRLAAMAEHLGFGAGAPEGEGWTGLDQAVASGVVARLAEELVESEGRGDVAGSYLGSRLAGPLVTRTVAAMALASRCPDPAPANVALHLHPDGWFDGMCFRAPTVALLADDPAAGQPGSVVVASPAGLRAWWAERVAASVGPLLVAVRELLPYGTRGLWGAVADRVGGAVLEVARLTGHPPGPAWEEASLLLDALSERAPVRLTRPEPFLVTASGREAPFQVKGTCCLYYLTVERPDPCGDGYCTTCPFTDPGHRRRKLARWLDEQPIRR